MLLCRCVEKVVNFVQLGELFYAGSHGLDIQGPCEGLCALKDPSLCSYQVGLFTWVADSQFATIRKLNGFARIRPGFAMLPDILRFNQDATASPAN